VAFPPEWFKGKNEPRLAPHKFELLELKSDVITEEQFTKSYLEHLNKYNPQKVYNLLNGKIVLCYCKSGSFCHRHILRKWLVDNGFEAEEIN
jgi:uncharacterized protein YeaO (DUF488 family)